MPRNALWQSRPLFIAPFILVLSLLLGAGASLTQKAYVLAVGDGDTLKVSAYRGDKPKKLRLYGIDAPELAQNGGPEAKKFTDDLVWHKNIEYTVMDTDQFNRSVSVVTLPDGRILNEELVKAGHAWVFRNYCKAPECERWIALEAQARSEKRGLWGQSNPQFPQQWRRQHPRSN